MSTDTTTVKNVEYSKAALFFDKYRHSFFWKKFFWHLMRWVLLSGLLYVLIYPLLFVISKSLMSYDDMLDPTTVWIPKRPTMENYKIAYNGLNYFLSFRNTLFLSMVTAIIQIFSCSFVGYGLARFKFKEKGIIFGLVILTMIIPIQTIIIPQYVFYKNFTLFGILKAINPEGINLLDSFAPFVLPCLFGLGLKSGLFIYIFRQFFRGMPTELEDSAYIDGAGPFQTYARVMFPNAKPAILTVFLFSFVWHWNDYFEPAMYLSSGNKYTLSQKLVNIKAYVTGSLTFADPMKYIPPSYAGVMLVLTPMLILYIFGQRFFVENVERSGIVG